MPNPEELARENIDKQLKACGWEVQSRNAMNLYAGGGVAGARGEDEAGNTQVRV